MIPEMTSLMKDIRMLEDCARALQSKGELEMVLLTREERDVIESYRHFREQE